MSIEKKFKIGDPVRLKANNQVMVISFYIIEKVDSLILETTRVKCYWLDGSETKYGEFEQNMLKKIK